LVVGASVTVAIVLLVAALVVVTTTLRDGAEHHQRALVFISVFWIDNIFAAFVADTMAECFPYSYDGWSSTIMLQLLLYDVANMAFCSLMVFGAMLLLTRHFKVESKDGVEVEVQEGSQAWRRRGIRDLCCRFVMYSASFTMAVSNKTVAYYGWYAVESALSGKTAILDSCNVENATTFSVSAVAYAIFVASLFTSISIVVVDRAAAQKSKTRRFVLQMIAESFAIAIGWSVFNSMETIFNCEVTMLQTTYGAFALAIVVSVLGFFAFKALATAGNSSSTNTSEGWSSKFWHRLQHFGLSAVLVVVALTIVYSFYVPLSTKLSLTDAQVGWVMLSIGVAFSVSVSAVGVYFDCDFGVSEERPVINYFFSVSGWVSCYVYWYGFDEFVSNWVSDRYGDHKYLISFILLASTMLLFGALSAALISFLGDMAPGDEGEGEGEGEGEPLAGDRGDGGGGGPLVAHELLAEKSFLMRCIADERYI